MKEKSEGCFNEVAILLVKISKTIDVSVGKEEKEEEEEEEEEEENDKMGSCEHTSTFYY